MKPRIIFRSDGDPKIGLGHLFRMAALAEVLEGEFERIFYTRAEPNLVNSSLAKFFDLVHFLNEKEELLTEAKRLSVELYSSDILVIDGYDLGPDYQRPFQEKGLYVVMMDDYHPHPVIADLVINIAGGDISRNYTGTFFSNYLFGFKYALLRKEFRLAASQPFKGDRNSIFLCLGGADPENRMAILLRDVLKAFPDQNIHAVVGSAYLHKQELFEEYGMIDRVKIHSSLDATAMVHLMQRAAIGFCSSSTISYEFLCCNENLVVVRTAANQVNLFNYLTNSGAAVSYSDWMKDCRLPENSPVMNWRKEMLDFRYIELFRSIQNEQKYHFELAGPSDMRLYFDWANDPQTRSQSFNSDPIPIESHEKWFKSKIQDPSLLFLKLMEGNTAVGQIRYAFEGDMALVNYSVDLAHRGKGLSSLLLKRSMKYLYFQRSEIIRVEGYVKSENLASLKAFKRIGFKEEVKLQDNSSVHHFSMHIREMKIPS